jgi:hypothetical protein
LTRALALAGLAILALASGACADEPALSPLKPAVLNPGSLEDVMRANATCVAFTNDCEICKRSDTGAPQCSTPGLACQPKEWRCDQPKANAQ